MKGREDAEDLSGHSHVSEGWGYRQWEQGNGHAQVTDGQVDDKELCWLQGGFLSIGHEEQDPIPQHWQHTWETTWQDL